MMNEIILQNGKKIWLSIISLRKFRITTNHPDIKVIRDDDGNFLEMKFSNLLSFKKGEKIVIKDDTSKEYITFTLNDISSISSTIYDGIEQKINKTCIFILPLLGINYVYFDYNYSLYNAYVSEDYTTLYLQYKFSKTDIFLELEEKLQSHPLFTEFFDYGKEFVVFKFKINNKYHNTIDKIMSGKYSSINEGIKFYILDFHGLRKESELGRILFKDEKYKKILESQLGARIPNNVDLMSVSNKEEEIWNYQNTSQVIGTVD